MADESFSELLGLATGGAVGYSQFKKIKQRNIFSPVLDPRANIVNRIQVINTENAYGNAIHRFRLEHALDKITGYQNKIDLLNKLEDIVPRAQHVGSLNAKIRMLEQRGVSRVSSVNQITPSIFSALTGNVLQSNHSLITSEWQAAIKSTFANPFEAKTFTLDTNPIEGIKASLRSNKSVLMQRAFYTFEKNMDRLISMGHTTSLGLQDVGSFIRESPPVGKASIIGLSDISDLKLRNTIESIQAALDRPFAISRRTIPGLPDQGEYQFGFSSKSKPVFTIPESFAGSSGSARGLIRTGEGLHNIYAPGMFSVMADAQSPLGEHLTYSQYKAQSILDIVNKENLQGDTPGLKGYFKEVETEVFKLADYMEPNISGDDLSFETIFKSNQLTVLDLEGRSVTGDARRAAASQLSQKGFTPASAESRFSLIPEVEMYGVFGERHDFARKPWQVVRQYTPTREAHRALRENPLMNESFDFLDSPAAIKHFNGSYGARAKTLYLSEDQIFMLNQMGHKIEEGELLLHESMKKQLEVSRTRRIGLAELDSSVVESMSRGGVELPSNLNSQINLSGITHKGLLGRSASGSILSTQYKTELIGLSPGFTKHLDKSTKANLDLIVRETIDMSSAEKMFGLKGMARFGDISNDFLTAVSSVTQRSIEDLQGMTGFARASDIKDDAKKLSALLSNFTLEGQAAGATFEVNSLATQIKDMKVSTAETFLSAQAESLGFKTTLSIANKTGGIGVTQLYFGGEKALSGAGNLSTIEPRLFTMLNMSNPGGMGSEFTNEILERLIRSNPEKVLMHQELMKTLGSIEGVIKPTEGSFVVPADELKDVAKMKELYRRGGFIETGLETNPHMYIPGYETVPALHPRLVASGSVVDTAQPSKIFRNMVSDVSAASSGKLSLDQLRERVGGDGGHLTQLFQETAIAGRGAGSVARGDLPGSRSGVLLSTIDRIPFEKMKSDAALPEVVVNRVMGVPRHFINPMLEEMEKLHGKEAMTAMRARFESGELVAGLGFRHPIIDAYSGSPVLMKMVDTKENVVLMSETMKKIKIGEESGYVNIGSLTGMAADKDIDNVSAILLSPKTEEKLRAQMLDVNSVLSKQMQSYTDHSIKMQLLKPKALGASDASASLAERRAAEATKLGIPKEEVGRLSTQISRAQIALGASNLETSRALRASSLLTWLEQTPISGKHIDIKNILSGMFEQQMSAVRGGIGGNAAQLEGTISSMIEGMSPDLKQLFGAGANIEGIGPVAGWNISETTKDIANVVHEFKSLPAESQLAAAVKYATPSRGQSIGFQDLAAARLANQLQPSGQFAESSRSVLANINRELSSAMNRARPILKPIAIGAAVAGATMAILGGSPGSMPAPENRQTKLTNPTRDDVEIPGITTQALGEPTVSPQLQQRTALLETGAADRRKGLRAAIQANGVTASQRQQLTDRMNSRYPGSQINVRVQDDRRTLNSHAISDILNS